MGARSRRTAYLPSGRAGGAALADDVSRIARHPLVASLLDAQRTAVVIVNPQRQVVASNLRFLAMAGVEDARALLGERFGEALGCESAGAGPDGCGTSRRCATCGVALATLAGLRGRAGERECALRVVRGGRAEELELRVTAVPFQIAGEPFTALLVADQTAERRRAALAAAPVAAARELADELRLACDALPGSGGRAAVERIAALADGVRGELCVSALLAGEEIPPAELPARRPVEVRAALRRLSAALRGHPAAGGRIVEIDPPAADAAVSAEPAALHHAALAMAVNAVEATRAGGTVRVTVSETDRETFLRVWNAGRIAEAARERLFERHASAKGPGRGQGTWAMKLLAERVLGARVEYTTSREDGTWFSLVLRRS